MKKCIYPKDGEVCFKTVDGIEVLLPPRLNNIKAYSLVEDVKYKLLEKGCRTLIGKELSFVEILKERYENFSKLFGICARTAVKVYKGVSYELLVKNNLTQVKKDFARFGLRGDYSFQTIRKIDENPEAIEQMIRDNQYNLIPIYLAFSHLNKTIPELKELFGKGAWKRLCKNSKTKNKLLYRVLKTMGINSLTIEDGDMFTELTRLSSSVLRLIVSTNRYRIDANELLWVDSTLKAEKKLTDKDMFEGSIILYRDTERMCSRTRQPFNPRWSLKRMAVEHDRVNELILLEEKEKVKNMYSVKPFSWLENQPDILPHQTLGEFTFELLTTAMDVYLEGMEMKHCVVAYSDRCEKGDYVVYSISKGGAKYATLGLTGRGVWGYTFEFSQCYGKRNSIVMDDPLFNTTVYSFIKSFNESLDQISLQEYHNEKHNQNLSLDNIAIGWE